jgi:lysylphosphatidylglycerol synthetase-like protein (DUF2156 family)
MSGPAVEPVWASQASNGASGEVGAILERHADHPSAALALNAGTAYFRVPGVDGVVAYREAGGYLFQFGGIFAARADAEPLLVAFQDFARARGRAICGVQVPEHEVDLYAGRGFRLNQMGRSYTLSLGTVSLRGTRFMKLRNKIKRARGSGVSVSEVGRECPGGEEALRHLRRISDEWLRTKGRHVKLAQFLVGEVESVLRPDTRCFLAFREARPIGFITYVPAFGRYRGELHDLTRRTPDSPPGTMELINLTALERFQAEGIPHLNFGMTPFVGVADRHPSHSPVLAWWMRTMERYGTAVYPARSQVDYKLKWNPNVIEAEYLAYEGRFRVGCLWQLLRLTRAI